jgi:hypothetical protein
VDYFGYYRGIPKGKKNWHEISKITKKKTDIKKSKSTILQRLKILYCRQNKTALLKKTASLTGEN